MSRALLRAEPAHEDTLVPIPSHKLEIARLARRQPTASRSDAASRETVTRVKVGLCRDRFDTKRDGSYFHLKLAVARLMQRKLRFAIVEVDDCEGLLESEHGFEVSLEPADAKRVARLRSAILRAMRAARSGASAA